MLFSTKKRGDASIRGGHDKTRGASVSGRGALATASGGAKSKTKVGQTTASTKRKPSDK